MGSGVGVKVGRGTGVAVAVGVGGTGVGVGAGVGVGVAVGIGVGVGEGVGVGVGVAVTGGICDEVGETIAPWAAVAAGGISGPLSLSIIACLASRVPDSRVALTLASTVSW